MKIESINTYHSQRSKLARYTLHGKHWKRAILIGTAGIMELNNSEGSSRIRVMRVIARMNIGGPAIQLSGISRNLNSEIFEHKLYTGYCAEDEVDYLDARAKDVTAIRVPSLGRKLSFMADLKAFVFLRNEIKSFRPHIVHTHTAKAGLITRLANITLGNRIVSVHTFHGHILKGYYGKTLTHLIILVERILAFFTSRIFVVGQIVLEELVEARVAKREKFLLMPPGLELGPLPSKIDARKTLGLSANGLMCGYIVRVTQVKRPDRFLEVVRESVKAGLDLTFVVAGDGDLLESTKIAAAKDALPVVFLGMVPNVELVFAAIDMVILTSDNEGMPLTLIQAGMAKLPSVTTDVGSARHVVLNGKSGVVVTNLDSKELYTGISLLFASRELRESMGSAAYEHCIERFSVNRLVKDHEREYLQLTNNRLSN
jgi:glycosyltransferase involved in cell wall biosynthesis